MKENAKALFRKKAIKKITKKRVNNYKKDKLVCKNLLSFILRSNIKDIMLFIPLKNEVNIAPLIKLLRQRGYNLYVPYMVDESFRLVKYRLPLFKKKFNIKEPRFSNRRVKNIDLAVVPVVGIDKEFKRIGFGKGMYDRFFERESRNIKETIFLARELYFSPEAITDHYDIEADILCAYSVVTL
jgi:5-formyltetrahydrofolate cyclo-ligase